MQLDKISIITPYYYGKKYLGKLCEMIEKNTRNIGKLALVEFILVNDSPEEQIEEDIIKKYKIEYQIIKNDKNYGIQYSRISGLKNAKGNYIVFLDQDDEISSNYLLSQYQKIGDNDVIISNGMIVKDGKTKPIYHSIAAQKKATILNKHKHEAQIISPGLCLIKKEGIHQYWCQNILKNLGADDYLLWIIMLYNNKKFVINPESLFRYHLSDNNYSKDKDRMKRSAIEACELIEKYDVQLYEIITKKFRKMQTINYHKEWSFGKNAYCLISNIPTVFYKIYKNFVKYIYKIKYGF